MSVPVDPESYCQTVPRRQNAIPVHYVTGTHYEVGYSVVSTLHTKIHFVYYMQNVLFIR